MLPSSWSDMEVSSTVGILRNCYAYRGLKEVQRSGTTYSQDGVKSERVKFECEGCANQVVSRDFKRHASCISLMAMNVHLKVAAEANNWYAET